MRLANSARPSEGLLHTEPYMGTRVSGLLVSMMLVSIKGEQEKGTEMARCHIWQGAISGLILTRRSTE